MGERTRLGLGTACAATILGLLGDGLLRAAPRGLNVLLFAPSALATGFLAVALLNALNPDALIVQTNLRRAGRGQELHAPYLASLSADAVPPLVKALPQLSDGDRHAVESGLRARWTSPAPAGDWRTYNLSRSRAYEALTSGPDGQVRDPWGDV